MPPRSRGFSLILSLVVMAFLLVTILSVAAFVTIESRLAAQHQSNQRARLNAAVALRLALAHLQQEAGPDRRITARADILANTTQAGWTWNTIRNPLWTGVWRSDLQLQPPSWLISGRHDRTPGAQSVNLHGQTDFFADQWVPWQNDYTIPGESLVPLVGDACATGAELATATSPGRPNGRISLPRLSLPDTAAHGSYCYWIGDEGVKARINLTDPRLTPLGAPTTPQLQQEALRGATRSGTDLMAGLATVPLGGIDGRITQMRELPFLTDGGLGLTETNPPTRAKRLFTDATLWSRGVNSDSLWGGLKVDLSLAFEQTDEEWRRSEFAEGAAPKDSAGAPLSGVTYVFHPTGTNTRTAFADRKVIVRSDGANRNNAPLYAFTVTGGSVRGPTWATLRSYHQLYKELDWTVPTAPVLRARALFPNTREWSATYGLFNHYGRLYNRTDSTSGDYMAAAALRGNPAPLPTKVAVSPYVCRQLMVWGLQQSEPGTGQPDTLRLTLTPVTVLHNPYNVTLRLAGDTVSGENSAMRLSFRNWDQLQVRFTGRNSAGTTTRDWTKTIGAMAMAADATSTANENFRKYIGVGTTLAPGEFRVFSFAAEGPAPSFAGPRPFVRAPLTTSVPVVPLTAANHFDTRGGFWMNCLDEANAPVTLSYGTGGENLTVALLNSLPATGYVGPAYDVRVLLTSWPGDRITESVDLSRTYAQCSELNALTATKLDRSGPPTSLIVGGTALVLPKPAAGPLILGILDYRMRWPKDTLPFPLFSHSNPMAAVTRGDADGKAVTAVEKGYALTSPSYKMTIRPGAGWNNVLDTTTAAGTHTFGGLSATAALGVPAAVYTEVPLAPPLSLAQFAHANFGLRDQEPLFQIGHSFAPLNAGIAGAYMNDSTRGIMNHDATWMANAAIFDRFFLSGAAPRIARGPVVSVTHPLAAVMDDFATGQGRLANPRTRLFATRDPGTIRAMLGSHRRIAGTILSDGTFNVNSTSVDAWIALLASAKRNAMGSAGTLQPAADQNARFPRAVRADAADHNRRSPLNDPKAWTGLASLDDAQIRLLAKSIVEETRMRIRYNHRNQYGIKPGLNVHYVIMNRGVEVPLPYVGLAQFVNRFNCGAYPNQVAWQGCLQNAILRADVDSGDLSNRSVNALPVFGSSQLTPIPSPDPPSATTAGLVPYFYSRGNVVAVDPRNTTNRGHALRGAPTSLTQADILAAVGSSLATRSDTFVIRCYGDATDPLDPSRTMAGCWMEAVVQRIPEFCDPGQPPETEVGGPLDGQLHNPLLNQMNRTLGRRFVILSTRTLTPKDL